MQPDMRIDSPMLTIRQQTIGGQRQRYLVGCPFTESEAQRRASRELRLSSPRRIRLLQPR